MGLISMNSLSWVCVVGYILFDQCRKLSFRLLGIRDPMRMTMAVLRSNLRAEQVRVRMRVRMRMLMMTMHNIS